MGGGENADALFRIAIGLLNGVQGRLSLAGTQMIASFDGADDLRRDPVRLLGKGGALLIERVGSGSSLMIVPTPWPTAMTALVGLERLTRNVSLASLSRSPLTRTVRVRLVMPGANVSTPLVET